MYHYTFGGLRNVWLENGYKLRKTPYGEAVSFTDGQGLEAAICKALARKQGRLTGAEFRYLRSSGLMLSQAMLAKMIGADTQTVARWEKGKVPMYADKLLRLLYTARADGNEPISRVVDRLQTVERLVKQRIVLHERRGAWRPEVVDETDEAEPAEDVV
jgi:DNA-binding transcriptional regulator YiaG